MLPNRAVGFKQLVVEAVQVLLQGCRVVFTSYV